MDWLSPQPGPGGELLQQVAGKPAALVNRRGEALPRMKVDVVEKDGAYLVTAELPGVRKGQQPEDAQTLGGKLDVPRQTTPSPDVTVGRLLDVSA